MNISTKQLKQACHIVCGPLMEIWNEEVIRNKINTRDFHRGSETGVDESNKPIVLKNNSLLFSIVIGLCA